MLEALVEALFLLVVPMFAVAPGVFYNRAATPKMLAIVLGLCFLSRSQERPRAAAQWPAIAFLAVCCLSWCFTADKWSGWAGAPKAPYYGIFGVALVVLAYLASTELEDHEGIDRALSTAGAAIGSFCLLQMVFQDSLIGLPMYTGRAAGFRGSPVMLGASLIPCLLASVHRRRPLCGLLILGGMLAAKAKGALLGSVVGLTVYYLPAARLWALLGGVLVAHLASRMSPDASNRERVELVNIAWKSFLQRPILGWGPDNFLNAMLVNKTKAYEMIVGTTSQVQASAHWDLAQVAATLGLSGLCAYIWGLWELLKEQYRDPVAPAVLCAMAVQAQVNPIPTDILVMVAVILGSRQADKSRTIFLPRWPAPLLAGAAITLAIRDLLP